MLGGPTRKEEGRVAAFTSVLTQSGRSLLGESSVFGKGQTDREVKGLLLDL